MLWVCWPLQVRKSTYSHSLQSSQLYIFIVQIGQSYPTPYPSFHCYIIMQIISKNQEKPACQNKNDHQLLFQKTVQTQAKNAKLAQIIMQKEQIVEGLRVSMASIEEQIELRRSELLEVKGKLEELERMETELGKLEERERDLESRHEDYLQLSTKLDRQLRFLHEEVQILKGKTIIEYNKVSEVRDEYASQCKHKQILCRHLEDLRKGLSNLKKRIHQLKQQQKKKVGGRHRIQEADIQREINNLTIQRDNLKDELQQQQANKDRLLSEQRYKEICKEMEKMRRQNSCLQERKKLNQKLLKDRQQLQQRIAFLKGVDSQFIEEKRLLLARLQEKRRLYQGQLHSLTIGLHQKEEQLNQLQITYPEGLINFRKNHKKKRQLRVKPARKIKQVYHQQKEVIVEEKTYRFKGHKLKRLLLYIVGGMLSLGLVLSHAVGYY